MALAPAWFDVLMRCTSYREGTVQGLRQCCLPWPTEGCDHDADDYGAMLFLSV